MLDKNLDSSIKKLDKKLDITLYFLSKWYILCRIDLHSTPIKVISTNVHRLEVYICAFNRKWVFIWEFIVFQCNNYFRSMYLTISATPSRTLCAYNYIVAKIISQSFKTKKMKGVSVILISFKQVQNMLFSRKFEIYLFALSQWFRSFSHVGPKVLNLTLILHKKDALIIKLPITKQLAWGTF